MRLLRFSWILLLLALPLLTLAHAYHATLAEMSYNAEKRQLEISLKVFTDDFERALSQGQPKPVHLADQPMSLFLTEAYLKRTLRIGTRPGEALPLQFLGMQRENDAYWLYLKVPLAKPAPRLWVRHTVLLAEFADQANILNFTAGDKKQSLLFRAGKEEQEL